MTEETVRYYEQRAAEYDRIYDFPHWQHDLAELRLRVPSFFRGRRVFEVACGTGYWTRIVAQEAASIHAIDVNEAPLAVARARTYDRGNVTFELADAYARAGDARDFTGGFGALWLSHVDVARLGEFLAAFHARLAADAAVLLFDERVTEDRKPPTSRTDAAGNRYEWRRLLSGERFEIIKNRYDQPRLTELFAPYGGGFDYQELERFWIFTYRLAGA